MLSKEMLSQELVVVLTITRGPNLNLVVSVLLIKSAVVSSRMGIEPKRYKASWSDRLNVLEGTSTMNYLIESIDFSMTEIISSVRRTLFDSSRLSGHTCSSIHL